MTNTHHVVNWAGIPEEVGGTGVGKRVLAGAGASLVMVRVPAGTVAPRHSHDHEQFVQVVDGAGVIETEQGERSFAAGTVFHFPPGAWHAARFEADTILIETNVEK
jgi:quercetin dioxygenase-like cupin family protein